MVLEWMAFVVQSIFVGCWGMPAAIRLYCLGRACYRVGCLSCGHGLRLAMNVLGVRRLLHTVGGVRGMYKHFGFSVSKIMLCGVFGMMRSTDERCKKSSISYAFLWKRKCATFMNGIQRYLRNTLAFIRCRWKYV